MKRLFIIPARGGSKGLPGKNVKLLHGKPLIHYSIEVARNFVSDTDICLTTDDKAIANCASLINYQVPFIRPAELADDQTSMNEVVLHALHYYASSGKLYDQFILLQPTSPLRTVLHVKEALALFSDDTDMVVSVCKSKANPYYNLFEADSEGWLHISKGDGSIASRQQAPDVYQYNGAIYIVNVKAFILAESFSALKKIRKYVMEEKYSVDIDDINDWKRAEEFLEGN